MARFCLPKGFRTEVCDLVFLKLSELSLLLGLNESICCGNSLGNMKTYLFSFYLGFYTVLLSVGFQVGSIMSTVFTATTSHYGISCCLSLCVCVSLSVLQHHHFVCMLCKRFPEKIFSYVCSSFYPPLCDLLAELQPRFCTLNELHLKSNNGCLELFLFKVSTVVSLSHSQKDVFFSVDPERIYNIIVVTGLDSLLQSI